MAAADLTATVPAAPAIDSGQGELPVVACQRKRRHEHPGVSRRLGPQVADGADLRARICRLGISQTEAARRLGLTTDGLAKQLSGARPVSRQTALLLQHLELGCAAREHEIVPPVDWALWDKLMRAEMADATDADAPAFDARVEGLYEANRHWLDEYRAVDWRRAMLLARYLVKRVNACRNHHRSPHQRSREQLPVPGG
jgi:hypothetical protein